MNDSACDHVDRVLEIRRRLARTDKEGRAWLDGQTKNRLVTDLVQRELTDSVIQHPISDIFGHSYSIQLV